MRGCELTLPAVRGIQAGKEFYIAMCPLAVVPRVFVPDESRADAAERAQRVLNPARIPRLARFLATNADDYAFSPITACIDGEARFDALGDDSDWELGRLVISLSADLLITDGQHRWRAIKEALRLEPGLADESIPVVLYVDEGVERRQQMFADLNMHAVRPTRSLGILYDHRDPVADLARFLVDHVPLFSGRTEVEKTTISNRSTALFTLSAIYQATAALLGKKAGESVSGEERDAARRYWTILGEILPGWSDLLDTGLRPWEFRSTYVHAHGVVLQALGIAGRALIETDSRWEEALRESELAMIDWSRSNSSVWEGRALANGRISKAQRNVLLTATLIKQRLGLSLTEREQELEEDMMKARRALKNEAA